jgi:hypothetical protein
MGSGPQGPPPQEPPPREPPPPEPPPQGPPTRPNLPYSISSYYPNEYEKAANMLKDLADDLVKGNTDLAAEVKCLKEENKALKEKLRKISAMAFLNEL